MAIDSFTVLLFGLLIKIVLGAMFMAFWLRNRSAPWFAWWSATLVIGSVASFFYMVFGIDSFIGVSLGNATLIASVTCCWQGARAFNRRLPLWGTLLLTPALWLTACTVDGFATNIPYRLVLSSSLIASLLALSAAEFWRGRAEPLPSRWPIIAIFISFACIFAIRLPLIDIAPFPFGTLPAEPGWLGAFNLLMSRRPSCFRCCLCRSPRSVSSSTSAPKHIPIR